MLEGSRLEIGNTAPNPRLRARRQHPNSIRLCEIEIRNREDNGELMRRGAYGDTDVDQVTLLGVRPLLAKVWNLHKGVSDIVSQDVGYLTRRGRSVDAPQPSRSRGGAAVHAAHG